ncbi:hypothetical protein [Pleionea sp. CnH1-48]|uniref:hypothetical protein n=1 Tax=Pleionea sp. CnH1-48 TaxID=2954494 RepID=UPI0020974B13|nr:hypothetical protein [Pleionea sp. CnH1-48]MCO7226530.1 hypothetical protein [Pleionea sp. CnH1-48]
MQQRILVLLISLGLLQACTQPLPSNKHHYAGHWKNHQTSLQISTEGRLNYQSTKAQQEYSGSVDQLTDKAIKVSHWFSKQSLIVNEPPYLEDGYWTMIINGEKVFRTDEQGELPKPTQVPPIARLQALSTSQLHQLANAITQMDYKDYLDQMSDDYKNQFTEQQLIELYRPFSERNIDISQYMIGDIQLVEEPNLNEEGVLTIKGKFDNNDTPLSLKYDVSFIYYHPHWKSLGMNIVINAEESI